MWRTTAAYSAITAAFAIILIRLFYWQIIMGDMLRVEASAQYNLTFTLPATRGMITSQDSYPLALSVPAYLAYAQPNNITDLSGFSRQIAEALSLDEKEVLSAITTPDRVWVPLKHKVEKELTDSLAALELGGLGFENESKRYYPESSMAAHLMGFVGSNEHGFDTGYFGLEGFYDRELRGKDGKMTVEKDVRGAPILVGGAKRIEAQDGRSLTLWIDRTIQNIVERRLLEGIEKYGAKEGTIIIMDPKTGGILAMASYPSYDQSDFIHYDKFFYKNPAVGATYEPGSTFKVLVMAAAIEEKAVTAATTMEEDGPVKVGDYSIRTWNNEYRGSQTMNEVIQYSSNVGMVFVQKQLGREKFLSYIDKFGFGKLTEVDLEDEASPEMRGSRDWRDIDLATASFGQGIAVTPMQMVRAVSALANDGWLMKPMVVKSISDTRGKVLDLKPKKIEQVVSKRAAGVVTEMMINAVDNGEAKWAKPKGYRIAGKTGTAQIPVAGHYDDKKTIASFVGFAPADAPAFVMLVTLREPTSSPWGSETAAPLFFTIARDIFLYKNISPLP